MSRKVKTPKIVLGSINCKIYYVIVISILVIIVYAGFKEKHSTVYNDNHVKVVYDNDEMNIKNNNEVSIHVKVVNGKYKAEKDIPSRTRDGTIGLFAGKNKVFISCKYFQDYFEITKE